MRKKIVLYGAVMIVDEMPKSRMLKVRFMLSQNVNEQIVEEQ